MRIYKRKTNRKPCTELMLQNARQKLEAGMSKRQIAKDLGITEASLRKRLKQGFGVTKLGRFVPVFSEKQEKELVEHIQNLDGRFYGLSFKDLRRLGYEFADRNNIPHQFNKDTQLAGKEWGLKFLKKHKLSLRTPSRTSLARSMGFNKTQVNMFFKNLQELMAVHQFPPSKIYNMDESGISTVPNKTPKVVSNRGKKAVGKISSAERGQTTTVICAVSASGNYIPPAIIFSRKRLKPELMHGAPPDSLMMCSDSGYSNSQLFIDSLKHFQKHVSASMSNPVLLVLDNHSSHMSLEAILFCRENNIHIISLPPHSSHKMQPLDTCFFKPLKDFFPQMCDTWLRNNPGRVVTQYQMAELFGEAYKNSATMGKGITGFKSCGIYPINPYIFSEEDFLPSSVTDQSLPEETTNKDNVKNSGMDTNASISNSDSSIDISLAHDAQSQQNETPARSSDYVVLDTKTWTPPSAIVPLPKRKTSQQRKSKKQKSEVLTSSPFKNKLEESEKRRNRDQPQQRNTKTIKKEQKLKHKADKITKQTKNPTGSTQRQAEPSSSSELIACPACEEKYEDPPDEDWIQCCSCEYWWHESCSNYEGGLIFTCDLCQITE